MSNRISRKNPTRFNLYYSKTPYKYRSILSHSNFINHHGNHVSLRIDSVNYYDKARKNLTEEIVNKRVTKVCTIVSTPKSRPVVGINHSHSGWLIAANQCTHFNARLANYILPFRRLLRYHRLLSRYQSVYNRRGYFDEFCFCLK